MSAGEEIMTKYVIDIVGTCNLKCPSCGRREHYAYAPSYKGLMDFGNTRSCSTIGASR